MCAAVMDTYALAARWGVRVVLLRRMMRTRARRRAAGCARAVQRCRRCACWCARKIAMHARRCVLAGAALPQRASRVSDSAWLLLATRAPACALMHPSHLLRGGVTAAYMSGAWRQVAAMQRAQACSTRACIARTLLVCLALPAYSSPLWGHLCVQMRSGRTTGSSRSRTNASLMPFLRQLRKRRCVLRGNASTTGPMPASPMPLSLM